MSRMARFRVRNLNRDALVRVRKERGLTQEDLALRIGLVTNTVRKWEGGHAQPNPEAFQSLIAVLGVDQSELLVVTDELDELAVQRQVAGLTQTAAAEATGILKHRLRDIERGVRLPTDAEARAIADVLNIDASEVHRFSRRLHEYRTSGGTAQ